MPTLLIEPEIEIAAPRRKLWTREEIAALERTGVLAQQHLELIEGELINKMGKNRPHITVATLMFLSLMEIFDKMFLQQEAPIDVAPQDNRINEPEPDMIVLQKSVTAYQSRNPRGDELHLVVEISDSTLYFDMKVKAGLYARAGILEYWVLDVQGRRLIVHRNPEAGKYRSIQAYSEFETVAPLAAPDKEFRVASVFAAS